MPLISIALSMAASAHAGVPAPEIPFRAGVTYVLAVNAPPETIKKGLGIVAGEYEMVVKLDSVAESTLKLTAYFDGPDESGVHRRGKVPRLVRSRDLASGNVQVQGYHSSDPPTIHGATALGPSRAFMRRLIGTGEAHYSFRQFAFGDVIQGTLRRVPGEVKFPVILNGKRVELTAVKAQGHLARGDTRAPYEMVLLDDPRHPLSLRIAFGNPDAGFPFVPRFAREIVRIDFPVDAKRIEETLEKDCRVEVPGIYFDFNLASIQPQSRPALESIASAVRAVPGRRLVIEGHTDDVGTQAYNDDLSSRRAAAVRDTLAKELGVDVRNVTTRGHGERKPIESNETIAGRARNRRVELSCTP